MTTVFARVAGAAVAALEAAPPVSSAVYRARMRAVSQQESTAVVVRLRQAEVDRGVGNGTPGIWATVLDVECYARALPGQSGDDAVDALLDATVARLVADPSLGGVVGDIGLLGVTWDFDMDGQGTACAVVTFSVRHATASASVSAP